MATMVGLCPPWDYTDAPDHLETLRERHRTLIRRLDRGDLSIESDGRDTRSVHGSLFSGLTPPDRPYYAGHYRGEPFVCLREYRVGVRSDPMVGIAPDDVWSAMTELATTIAESTALLDMMFAGSFPATTEQTKLYHAVAVAAAVFQEILTIHPYANGNGHIARFLVWLLLGRFGYRPTRWTIDPRPATPHYGAAISLHRRGDAALLERLIIESLL